MCYVDGISTEAQRAFSEGEASSSPLHRMAHRVAALVAYWAKTEIKSPCTKKSINIAHRGFSPEYLGTATIKELSDCLGLARDAN